MRIPGRKADEHRWVQDRLSPYLDGRLDPEERERVEAHLRACAACARSFETLRWTVQALRALPPVRAPRPLALRPEQVARAPRPAGGLRWAAWAMAAALILVLGLDLMRGMGTTALPTAPAAAPAERAAPLAVESERAGPAPTPAPMFGLAVPPTTPTATAEAPGAAKGPSPIPAPPLSPLRVLEGLLLLGTLGLLALDRWRGRRAG